MCWITMQYRQVDLCAPSPLPTLPLPPLWPYIYPNRTFWEISLIIVNVINCYIQLWFLYIIVFSLLLAKDYNLIILYLRLCNYRMDLLKYAELHRLQLFLTSRLGNDDWLNSKMTRVQNGFEFSGSHYRPAASTAVDQCH